LSSGEPFTSNGPFSSAIAYLQTGNCLLNGEGCTLVETTLVNPTCIGCGSSTDISLIPPHAYSVPVSFSYYGGCTNQGASCSSPTCPTAFFVPNDNQVQVECQDNNVNLLITFCAGGSGATSKPTSSSAVKVSTQVQIASTPTAVLKPAVTLATTTASTTTTTTSASASPQPAADAPTCSSKRQARRRRSLTEPSKQARSPRMVHEHMRSERRHF